MLRRLRLFGDVVWPREMLAQHPDDALGRGQPPTTENPELPHPHPAKGGGQVSGSIRVRHVGGHLHADLDPRGRRAVRRAAPPAAVDEVADRRPVIEAAYDPWRFRSEALRLEREHGVRMVDFPQSHARLVPASEGLHAAIVERRLRHPADPNLDRHVAGAVATSTGRGWRLEQSEHSAQIDAVIALAMAVDRAAQPAAAPARLIGWA